MAPTAKDLAKVLNISASTVSMVLNNRPGISEKTKQRVLAEADRIGLKVPSRNKSSNISPFIHFVIYKKHGKVVSDTPFFAQLFEGIDSETKKHDFNLQVTYFYENKNIDEQLNNIKSAESAGMLILATEMDADDMDIFSSIDLPIVVLDAYFEHRHHDTVVINNVQGAFNATSYLLNKGHHEIGYLRSKIRIQNFIEREDGFLKALNAHNKLKYFFDVEPTTEGAYNDMCAALEKSSSLPTAFFADNDIIAAACMRALREKGYNLPDDVSIIGFDDMTPLCEIIEPPLTTMRVPKRRLGKLAIDRLIADIQHNTAEIIKLEVSTELKERCSVDELSV